MRSHLTVVEYWRWWVVHLWVEGFFEVFATVVIAFLFARLRVIRADHAAYAALLSGAIYLSGGIIGTLASSLLCRNADGRACVRFRLQRA